MRTLLLTLAVAVALPASGASNPGFSEGILAYEAGRFEEAARAFEASGPSTVNGLFNLGNAWARAGQPGKAALAYERTLLLVPSHFEARHNLRHVRGAESGFAGRPNALASVPPDLPVLAGAAAAWIALFALTGLLMLPRQSPSRKAAGPVLGIALALLAAAIPAAILIGRGPGDPRLAVLTSPQPEPARFAPARNADPVVQIAPGQRVRILSRTADWVYCAFSETARGWLPATSVRTIRPLRCPPNP